MIVNELIQETKYNKIWLCPNKVSDPTFVVNPYLKGMECTRSTIPIYFLDKEVVNKYHEGGFLCIIWRNE